jgi:hypothetical protein
MRLDDLISSCPPGVDLQKYVTAHLKGVYRQHVEFLRTASEKDNPLQPDAVAWLNEAQQLALDIKSKGIRIDAVADGYVGRLAAMNVPRETIVMRDMARKSGAVLRQDNRATVWRDLTAN